MERHIFELLWPLFGFCQYLGLFPCKRTIDPISGSIQLRPIHWLRQLAFFLIIGMSLGVFGNMTIFIPSLLEGKGIKEMYKCLQSANPAAGTVFENHRKSLIQHCERSELHLHFEWTKVS